MMIPPKLASILPALAALIPSLHALPSPPHADTEHRCPPLPPGGDIVISYYQLYAENADWDPVTCRVWFGALWNATAATYNPYTNTIESVLAFPGISHTGTVHIGGVAWDPYNTAADGRRDVVSILVDSARPWATAGADVSGERGLIKYDSGTGKVLWTVNVTDVSRGRYGGFQDVEHDRWGRTYIVGTWPGTILRVERDGTGLREWLVPDPLPPTTQRGYSGLAVVAQSGGRTMLTVNGTGLFRFELREEQERGDPVQVPIWPDVRYNDTDAIYLPPVYEGRVLLVASLHSGIQVLRSKDLSWRAAEYLGTIPIPTGELYDGGNAVASVQMGSSSVFMVVNFNFDTWVPGQVAGNRTQFGYPDITEKVGELLRQ